MTAIDEIEGKPQKGLTLAGTINAIVSVVQQSRGEVLSDVERAERAQALETRWETELKVPELREGEAQEKVELGGLRSALYGGQG